jgi:hypothetical protein
VRTEKQFIEFLRFWKRALCDAWGLGWGTAGLVSQASWLVSPTIERLDRIDHLRPYAHWWDWLKFDEQWWLPGALLALCVSLYLAWAPYKLYAEISCRLEAILHTPIRLEEVPSLTHDSVTACCVAVANRGGRSIGDIAVDVSMSDMPHAGPYKVFPYTLHLSGAVNPGRAVPITVLTCVRIEASQALVKFDHVSTNFRVNTEREYPITFNVTARDTAPFVAKAYLTFRGIVPEIVMTPDPALKGQKLD